MHRKSDKLRHNTPKKQLKLIGSSGSSSLDLVALEFSDRCADTDARKLVKASNDVLIIKQNDKRLKSETRRKIESAVHSANNNCKKTFSYYFF